MKSKQFLLLILFISIFAQSTAPQLDKIKQQDLKDNLYELAGDAFKKKRRRTWRNELLGGSKAREAGLKPAGEDGTTSSSLISNAAVANSSTVSVNGKELDL
jgi:hypothetical protein